MNLPFLPINNPTHKKEAGACDNILTQLLKDNYYDIYLLGHVYYQSIKEKEWMKMTCPILQMHFYY